MYYECGSLRSLTSAYRMELYEASFPFSKWTEICATFTMVYVALRNLRRAPVLLNIPVMIKKKESRIRKFDED